MVPYLIPVLISILCAIQYDINGRKGIGKQLWFIFLYIYLTLLVGLRYHVGGDSLVYEKVFDVITNDLSTWHFTFVDIYQPGFTFLYALSRSISPEFYCFQIIHALILNTLLFLFISKYSKYRFLSLLLIEYAMYLYFSTEILREALAVLIFTFNYPNYREKKWIKYLIGVAISILFHISASFLLIIPFLHSLKFNRKFFFFCLGLFAFIPVLYKVFGTASDNIIAHKISRYKVIFFGYFETFSYVLSGAIFPIFILWYLKKNKIESRFETLICIQIIFGLASVVNPIIFGRLTNYFVLFFLLTLAELFHTELRSRSRILKRNSLIIALFFVLTYSPQYLNQGKYIRYIPYSSILNPVEYERDYTLNRK